MRLRGAHRALWLAPLGLVVERFHLFSLPVPRHAGAPGPDVAWRAVEEGDLPRLVEANPRWTVEELRARLDAGHCGFLREIGGRVAHCRWVAAGETELPYLGRRFRPGPRRALSIEAFTAPESRRAGLYREGLEHALAWAAGEGADELLFFVAWWHRPTVSVLRSFAAARRIGSVTRVLGARRASGRAVEVTPGVFGVD